MTTKPRMRVASLSGAAASTLRAIALAAGATYRPKLVAFAGIEQVKRFAILERDLTQAAGELTPTRCSSGYMREPPAEGRRPLGGFESSDSWPHRSPRGP